MIRSIRLLLVLLVLCSALTFVQSQNADHDQALEQTNKYESNEDPIKDQVRSIVTPTRTHRLRDKLSSKVLPAAVNKANNDQTTDDQTNDQVDDQPDKESENQPAAVDLSIGRKKSSPQPTIKSSQSDSNDQEEPIKQSDEPANDQPTESVNEPVKSVRKGNRDVPTSKQSNDQSNDGETEKTGEQTQSNDQSTDNKPVENTAEPVDADADNEQAVKSDKAVNDEVETVNKQSTKPSAVERKRGSRVVGDNKGPDVDHNEALVKKDARDTSEPAQNGDNAEAVDTDSPSQSNNQQDDTQSEDDQSVKRSAASKRRNQAPGEVEENSTKNLNAPRVSDFQRQQAAKAKSRQSQQTEDEEDQSNDDTSVQSKKSSPKSSSQSNDRSDADSKSDDQSTDQATQQSIDQPNEDEAPKQSRSRKHQSDEPADNESTQSRRGPSKTPPASDIEENDDPSAKQSTDKPVSDTPSAGDNTSKSEESAEKPTDKSESDDSTPGEFRPSRKSSMHTKVGGVTPPPNGTIRPGTTDDDANTKKSKVTNEKGENADNELGASEKSTSPSDKSDQSDEQVKNDAAKSDELDKSEEPISTEKPQLPAVDNTQDQPKRGDVEVPTAGNDETVDQAEPTDDKSAVKPSPEVTHQTNDDPAAVAQPDEHNHQPAEQTDIAEKKSNDDVKLEDGTDADAGKETPDKDQHNADAAAEVTLDESADEITNGQSQSEESTADRPKSSRESQFSIVGWLLSHFLFTVVLLAACVGSIVYYVHLRASGGSSVGFMPIRSHDEDQLERGGNDSTMGQADSSMPSFSSLTGSKSGDNYGEIEDVVGSPSSGASEEQYKLALLKHSNSSPQGAQALVETVLTKLGIPSYGQSNFTSKLQDNYLNQISQLYELDSGDWKRLDFPLVIEEAIRQALEDRKALMNGQEAGNKSKSKTSSLSLKAPTKPPAKAPSPVANTKKSKPAVIAAELSSEEDSGSDFEDF